MSKPSVCLHCKLTLDYTRCKQVCERKLLNLFTGPAFSSYTPQAHDIVFSTVFSACRMFMSARDLIFYLISRVTTQDPKITRSAQSQAYKMTIPQCEILVISHQLTFFILHKIRLPHSLNELPSVFPHLTIIYTFYYGTTKYKYKMKLSQVSRSSLRYVQVSNYVSQA